MKSTFYTRAITILWISALFTFISCASSNIATNKADRQRDKARNLRGGCCFTADTRVRMADGTEKFVNQLVVGDNIVSFNLETGKSEPAQIQGVVEIDHTGLIEYVFETHSLKATTDHPFYLKGKGWASSSPAETAQYFNFRHRDLATIEPGDIFLVQSPSGELVETKLMAIHPVEGIHPTWSIVKLSRNEAYFANGTLTGVEELATKVVAIP